MANLYCHGMRIALWRRGMFGEEEYAMFQDGCVLYKRVLNVTKRNGHETMKIGTGWKLWYRPEGKPTVDEIKADRRLLDDQFQSKGFEREFWYNWEDVTSGD